MRKSWISETNREMIHNRDNWTCWYCAKDLSIFRDDFYKGRHMHIDHLVPVSRGGPHELWNFVTACAKCNLQKKHKTLDEFRQTKLAYLIRVVEHILEDPIFAEKFYITHGCPIQKMAVSIANLGLLQSLRNNTFKYTFPGELVCQ
jgi:hypothetical protein